MARVIRGVFPESAVKDKKREPVASYLLHISIMFSDPLIWRRIQVPGEYTLARLHEVIQRVMGWDDNHIHQFLVGKISYEATLRGGVPLREARRFDEHLHALHTLEEGMGFLFTYLYGAGEGWEHEIRLEEVLPPDRPLNQPLLLSGAGACPPEAVADIHEYQALLAGRDGRELTELAGRPDFEPSHFDIDAARKRLAALA